MKTVNKLATLTEDLRGRVTFWKRGTVVLVTHKHLSWYAIERIKHRKNALPLEYQMAGVPKRALEFHEPR